MPVSKRPRLSRKGPVSGDGRRSRLDRNERARFRFKLHVCARTGRLLPKHQWVGDTLASDVRS